MTEKRTLWIVLEWDVDEINPQPLGAYWDYDLAREHAEKSAFSRKTPITIAETVPQITLS